MTNYELFFQEQIENSHFAKAYYEARFERISDISSLLSEPQSWADLRAKVRRHIGL